MIPSTYRLVLELSSCVSGAGIDTINRAFNRGVITQFAIAIPFLVVLNGARRLFGTTPEPREEGDPIPLSEIKLT